MRIHALLVAASAGAIGLPGLAQLVLSLVGTKLHPRDDALRSAMARGHPQPTRRTTMWKTWIGSNRESRASHSYGALLATGLVLLLALAHLGSRHWFSAPLRGIVLSLALHVSALAALLLLGGCTGGPPAKAARFSAAGLQPLTASLQEMVDRGEIPGAVVLIARHGEIVRFDAIGFADREAAVPMRRDAIFRIASMTKPVVSVAAMMLVEQGRLSLADPVSRHLPEFKDVKVGVERIKNNASGTTELVLEPPQREMTVHDLLRHTSGLVYGFIGRSLVKDRYNAAGLYDPAQTLADVAAKLSRLPLQHQPGTTWEYGMSTDLLGRLVEVASGLPLERALAEMIFAPLGMTDTAFTLTSPAQLARVAQPQVLPGSGIPGRRPYTPDPARRTWPSGGGGLVSTAGDYARFGQMLLNGGQLHGVRLLRPQTVAQMLSDQLPPGTRVTGGGLSPIIDVRREASGQSFGLGFAVRVAPEGHPSARFPGTPGDASWTGGFGTQFWIDPKEQLLAILMMQTAPLSPANPLPSTTWLRMREGVYGALRRPQ